MSVSNESRNAPYYAYGVINDQVNSDGSFVPPMLPTGVPPSCALTDSCHGRNRSLYEAS